MIYKEIVRNIIKHPLIFPDGKHYHLHKILTSKDELRKGEVTLVAENGKEYTVDLSAFVDLLVDGDCIFDDNHSLVALYFDDVK